MNVQAIAPRLQRIVHRYMHMEKHIEQGASLVTVLAETVRNDDAANVLHALESGEGLAQPDAQKLIWIVDLVSVFEPDNINFLPRPELVELSTTLRQQYFDVFGKNVYAG